jgi:hypothetical protein
MNAPAASAPLRRSSLFSLSLALFCLLSISVSAAFAQPKNPVPPIAPLDPNVAEQEARALVANLLGQKPAANTTNTGTLILTSRQSDKRQVQLRFDVVATATNWQNVYETISTNGLPAGEKLTVIHTDNQPNEYVLESTTPGATNRTVKSLAGNAAMIPFAGSDFWLADLGLEFLHWPKQRLLKHHQMSHSTICDELESINPQSAPGAYVKVISYIAVESGGIVEAQAYDAKDNLLKQFVPKKFEKVNGQWQVKEVRMENPRERSKSLLHFDPEP